jgi:hypothetical protein
MLQVPTLKLADSEAEQRQANAPPGCASGQMRQYLASCAGPWWLIPQHCLISGTRGCAG